LRCIVESVSGGHNHYYPIELLEIFNETEDEEVENDPSKVIIDDDDQKYKKQTNIHDNHYNWCSLPVPQY
jgi:hypothetical protein